MITLPLVALTAAFMAVAYFVCGIPFGAIIAKRGNVDVRKVGSGNIGTTNVARSVGKLAAAETLLLDVGKAALCVLVARVILGLVLPVDEGAFRPGGSHGWMLAFVYLATILGHVFSPYLGFHGGKGIAVGFGGAIALGWPLGVGLLVVFLLFAIPTRYVSLGSVMAAASLAPLSYFQFHPTGPFLLAMLIVAVVVIWAHRENIDRLLKGTESQFSFKSSGKAQKGGIRYKKRGTGHGA